MTAYNVIRLWCDQRVPPPPAGMNERTCMHRFEVVAGTAETGRQAAAAKGWSHDGDKDYCTAHTAAKEQNGG